MSSDTVRLVDVGAQRLRVDDRRRDDDRVPLLLCNGIGANLELWEPFVTALDRPTVTFDAPGVGGSSIPMWPPSMRGLAGTIVAMLDQLAVPRVDLLGLSWGGALAQELAHRHGDRVRRLVLAATLPGWTAVPGDPRVLAKMATPRRYRDPDHLQAIAAELYGGEVRQHPGWLQDHGHQRFLHQSSTRGYVWQLLAPWGWTSLPWLHTLAQPTLVVAGDDDPIIPLVNGRLMAARIPRARLHVVRGGGHLFLLTRAASIGGLVATFLDDDPSPGDGAAMPWHAMLRAHMPGASSRCA